MAQIDDHDGREARQVERVAKGYLAIAAGDAGRALRMMAADRLAETNGEGQPASPCRQRTVSRSGSVPWVRPPHPRVRSCRA